MEIDSELKRRWEAVSERKKKLRLRKDKSSGDYSAEKQSIEKEVWSIEQAWGELVRRRRAGELTDTTRTDQVIKIVSDLVKLHGFKTRYVVSEAERTNLHIATEWVVQAIYDGDLRSFDLRRWERVMDLACMELENLDFVTAPARQDRYWMYPEDGPRDFSAQYGDGEYEDEDLDAEDLDFSQPEDVEPVEDAIRVCYWYVDTIVWNGPRS